MSPPRTFIEHGTDPIGLSTMTWNIDFANLSASHTSGLKVNPVPDGKGKYFFQATECTKHHLDSVPNKTACIADLGAQLMRILERPH
jgi:hypothetical protein